VLSTIPQMENTLSLGVDVPVTESHFLAASATLAYLVRFTRHHYIGSNCKFLRSSISFKYVSTSCDVRLFLDLSIFDVF